MTVKASDTITLASVTDVSSITPYYLAQASTLSPPTFSASTISNWSTSEPPLDTSKTCYIAFLTTFSDNTKDYSTVSTMSEYEASKTAYNLADSASGAIEEISSNISEINGEISTQQALITETKSAVENIQDGYIRWDATANKMIQVVNPDGSQEVVNDFLSGWLQFTMDTTINKPVLSLGSNNESDMSVNLRPDRLSFLQGGNEVAYISNNTLFITQSVVLEQMDVGRKVNDIPSGFGQWSWRVHSVNYSGTMRNNLYLKWLG